MSDFLRELGYAPWRYWLFAGSTFSLWLVSALMPFKATGRLAERLNRPASFGVLLLLVMFAWRWPGIFHYKPVNPDESQFLAGALTMLARNSIWWCDPMTSGPLVVLPLALLGWIGLPVDFTNGRLIALLLSWGTVFLTYQSLRHIHGDRSARMLVMPFASLMIFLSFWDFVPYCSEFAPLLLCSLAAWLCLRAFTINGLLKNRWRLLQGGLVIGLIPFSKLQAIPLAACIGFAAFVWLLFQPDVIRKRAWQDALCLIASVGLGLSLAILSLWLSGQGSEVYESYVIHNLYYTRSRGMSWEESAYILRYLTDLSWGFYAFHCGMLLLLAIAQFGLRRTSWRPMFLGWAMVAAGYCAVLVPGRLYPHYLLFLSLPQALAVGIQFGYLLNPPLLRYRTMLVALFLLIGTGTQLFDRIRDRHSLEKLIRVERPRDQVSAFINQVKQPGDTLTVWGWRPELYVETQLPQGTREALTEAQLSEHPQRDYFRARFLADLKSSESKFFVDAVGPDDYLLTNRSLQGHEVIPGLGEYVAANYSPLNISQSFRVYVRRSASTDKR